MKLDRSPRSSLPVEVPNVSRDDLPEYFKSLGFTTGVEIGTYKGEFMELFCKAGFKMFGVDPWLPYEDYNDKRVNFKAQQDTLYNEAKKRLAPYDNCTLVRKTSMEAVKDFEDESLDFVYIDGHHGFKYVAEDIWEWSKKVRPGGVICGHDYFVFRKDHRSPYCSHVKQVVDAYTNAIRINPWFVLGEKRLTPGNKRDKWRSWLWFK